MRPERICEEKKIQVAAADPYPAVCPSGPNRRIVQLLLQDIAYSKGEMSAIGSYLYQHWTLESQYPLIASTLLRIGEVEIAHLNILGTAVAALGGDPKLCCIQKNSCQCWSGNMIRYGGTPLQKLSWDLSAERDTADLYTSQARFVKDENISAILNRLAADEKIHCQVLERFIQSLPAPAQQKPEGKGQGRPG